MAHSATSTRNSSIDGLTTAHQERVAEIVESCMVALENGNDFEADEIVAAHPEFAEPLKKCLASLRTLHEAMHADETMPSHPMLQVAGQLGDFILGEVLGRGGMGIVYAAKQISLNRHVAVKVLLSSAALQPLQLKRFMLEAKAAAQLQHAHIVPIYSVGEERGIHYHSMQLIDGHSLDKDDSSRWNANHFIEFLRAGIALADAIQHSHDCGIIHRDIKPSNLLIDKSGKVWITDFGLARSTQESGLTQSGDLLGTVNYMSPEQAMGKPVDQRTDIYSLGVTFYEMLTGKQAFEGSVRPEICRRIEREEPIHPRKLNREIPHDLETVLLKAMSKDREDRYLTAADFASDLMAVRDGRPIAARRPSLLQIGLRWMKLHQTLAMVAMAGIAATFLAVLIGGAQVWRAHKQLQAALSTSERHRENAQQIYWQSRNLLDKWNGEVIHKLAEVPGAEMVRSQMLTDTIEYYDLFLARTANQEDFRDDPTLQSDAANARLQLATSLMHSGDLARAKSSYELAIAELKELSTVEQSRRIAIAQNDLAIVCLTLNQPNSAINHLNEAMRLYQENNSNSDAEKYIAATYVNLARAYRQLGDRTREVASLNQAASLYRSHLAKGDEQTEMRSEFATVLDHLALLSAESDLTHALKLSAEAVLMHKNSVTQDRSQVAYVQRLGASLHNFAVLIAKEGEAALAKERFAEAIEVKLNLANSHAAWPGHWQELAKSQSGLGLLECQNGSWLNARDCFESAACSLRTLIQVGNAQLEHRLMLADALVNIVKADSLLSGFEGSGLNGSGLEGSGFEEARSKELIVESREIAIKVMNATTDESLKRSAQEILSDLDSMEAAANSKDRESRS